MTQCSPDSAVVDIADELHEFCAAAPHDYPGHLIKLFERAERMLRHLAPLAQRIEHEPSKLGVEGSNPSGRATATEPSLASTWNCPECGSLVWRYPNGWQTCSRCEWKEKGVLSEAPVNLTNAQPAAVTGELRQIIHEAMAWQPSENGPSYGERRDELYRKLDAALAMRAPPQAVGTTDIPVPAAALAWLFGEAAAPDGRTFGDDEDVEIMTPRKYSRKYWWRSRFRSMIPALTRPK